MLSGANFLGRELPHSAVSLYRFWGDAEAGRRLSGRIQPTGSHTYPQLSTGSRIDLLVSIGSCWRLSRPIPQDLASMGEPTPRYCGHSFVVPAHMVVHRGRQGQWPFASRGIGGFAIEWTARRTDCLCEHDPSVTTATTVGSKWWIRPARKYRPGNGLRTSKVIQRPQRHGKVRRSPTRIEQPGVLLPEAPSGTCRNDLVL